MSHMNNIKKYYEDNYKEGYPDYYIQGWENRTAQEMRFKELINSIDLNGKRILDVGCGTGNLLEYINERFTGFEYTGVDILPHMINIAVAKKLTGKFICMDLFKNNPFKSNSFDAIFSSGIFNLNLGNNKEFLFDALDVFQQLSNGTIAFNLLWDKSPDREDKYFYFDPDKVEQLLTERYNHWAVTISKGYLNNDFTVLLKKK